MTLPKISFVKGQGGLNRSLPGEDYISGAIFYDTTTTPTGFSTNKIQKILNIVDAENLGILNDYSDGTKATSQLVVGTTGATNDRLYLSVGIDGAYWTLCDYYSVGSLHLIDEATAIAAAINSLTYQHNFTATVASGSTITISAPVGSGYHANSYTLVKSITGIMGLTGTLAFTGGVGSKLSFYHYQIAEFFRFSPNGVLWTMFSTGSTFAPDVLSLQQSAEGKLRQIAVYQSAVNTLTTGNVSSLHNAIISTEATYGVSFNALYSTSSIQTLAELPDLSTLSCNKVSVVIGEGLSGEALKIKKALNKSVPSLGSALGVLASSNVAEDIAWVGKYNLSDGTELEIAGFQTHENVNNVSVNLLEQLNGYRYIYLRKFVGVTGTFFNDSNVSIASSSDYAYIENNRTIDKAIRQVKTALFPQLNSPIDLNADGTLTDVTIAFFKSLSNTALENMFRNGELSAYSTSISNTQDVLSTSTINIVIAIVPKGVARQIIVNIGFTTKL